MRPVRLVVAAVCGSALFAVLAVLVAHRWASVTDADGTVSRAAARAVHHHHPLRVAAEVATQLGNPSGVSAAVVLAAVVLFWQGHRRFAVAVAAARLAGLGAESLVKTLVDRPRPVTVPPIAHALGPSFPSGHATGAGVLAMSAALLLVALGGSLGRGLRSAVLVVLLLYALTVAASRVLLVVHYPSDVVAGLLLGVVAASASFAAALTRRAR